MIPGLVCTVGTQSFLLRVVMYSVLESIIVEVDIVSLSNYVIVLGRPLDSENRILYSPFVKQGKVRSLSWVDSYAQRIKSICHIGYASQEGAYYRWFRHVNDVRCWNSKVSVSIVCNTTFKHNFEKSINTRH